MEYSITALNGDSVKVESENWMIAMGKAMAFFDIDINQLERLACSPAKDGSVFIEDATGKRSWMVRTVSVDIAVRVGSNSQQERWEPIKNVPTASDYDASLARPDIVMPVESSLKKEEPATLGEHLFNLTMEIDSMSVEQACGRALEIVMTFVPSGAGSAVLGNLNDPSMRFVAARGPKAARVEGTKVQFGEGLIGMCFDMRGTLLVNDVASDTMHLDHLSDSSAEVLAVLCAPILDEEGSAHGVLQFVNPHDRQFSQAHVDVVETVSRTLASSFAHR